VRSSGNVTFLQRYDWLAYPSALYLTRIGPGRSHKGHTMRGFFGALLASIYQRAGLTHREAKQAKSYIASP